MTKARKKKKGVDYGKPQRDFHTRHLYEVMREGLHYHAEMRGWTVDKVLNYALKLGLRRMQILQDRKRGDE